MSAQILRRIVLWCLIALGPAALAEKLNFIRVERATIEQRLKEPPRKNAERGKRLKEMLGSAGCAPELLVEQKVKGSKLPNVVCTLKGATDSVIVVGAHYDFVNAGQGVVDNWSGAALLPSLLASLKDHPRKHTFIFVGFSDEEVGLVGSKAYVKQLSKEEIGRYRAMVNMDSLGLSPTKVWVSRADKRLVDALGNVAGSLKLPVAGVNVEKVGSTDSVPFAQAKIPSITIHSVTQETLEVLHSTRDNMKAIQMDSYYDTYNLLAVYLAYLDTILE